MDQFIRSAKISDSYLSIAMLSAYFSIAYANFTKVDKSVAYMLTLALLINWVYKHRR